MSNLSLKVPGSLSSALLIRYICLLVSFGINPHFTPVGKPAPPLPRRFESFTSWVTSSGFIFNTLSRAVYPPTLL